MPVDTKLFIFYNNIIIHIFIQFLVSCLEHLYRETEKESTKYPCALDSRGTILEK